MKLLKLELCNFRGVRSDLCIEPNGENMIILGPNGTGKSTLVDAIDFLLSGTIDRLLGEGTKGVTLQRHGHHIDARVQDAWVRALVTVPGISKPVCIERRLSDPQNPEVERQAAMQLGQIFTLARNGQHILTRREVLRFITSPASKRAERMQALLGISEIAKVRGSLVRVRGLADKQATATHRTLLNAQSALAATIGAEKFDVETLFDFINVNRRALNVEPLIKLVSEEVRSGIDLSFVNGDDKFPNPNLLNRDVNNLKEQLSAESRSFLYETESRLLDAIRLVHEQPALHKVLRAHKLTLLGLELIDETGECPLCDTAWPAGQLHEHLQKKLEEAKTAHEIHGIVKSSSDALANAARIAMASIGKIIDAANMIGNLDAAEKLEAWSERLVNLVNGLEDPAAGYLLLPYSADQVASLLADDAALLSIESVGSYVRNASDTVSPEQTAYDLLIRLATELESWEKAAIEDRAAQKTYRRAKRLVESFEQARDSVLGAMYDNVRDRFEQLYRQLHAVDEGGFTSILEPDGPGVAFEVDYYGRGKFPPTAIHSEGHQDSMGVCLFLALAEHTNKGRLELIVLDDVLMAIDRDHRRAFSQLLKKAFPDRQFLITTHDRTWANQLKYQGVVNPKGFLEITHWDLVSGPRINSETDVWRKIEQDLEKNDIHIAAARLRRSSEEFYEQVCHHLKARVPYNMTGRYQLGDLLPAAQSRYKELLKKAKAAANSWNDEELCTHFAEIDEVRQGIYSQLNVEQWAVNPAVHYNNWENFTPADFRPVVEAFQNLQDLFMCPNCRGIIQFIGFPQRSVRCNCNRLNWNLEKK